jgi:hypothetical protein
MFFSLQGTTFWRGTSSTRTTLTINNQYDPLHLSLFALQKQSRFGSYLAVGANSSRSSDASSASGSASDGTTGSQQPLTGSETPQQIEAWKELGEMPTETAKCEFLRRLFVSAPYWKYEQFL